MNVLYLASWICSRWLRALSVFVGRLVSLDREPLPAALCCVCMHGCLVHRGHTQSRTPCWSCYTAAFCLAIGWMCLAKLSWVRWKIKLIETPPRKIKKTVRKVPGNAPADCLAHVLATQQGHVQKRAAGGKIATASKKPHNPWLLQGTDQPADNGKCKVSRVIARMTEIFLLAQLPHVFC